MDSHILIPLALMLGWITLTLATWWWVRHTPDPTPPTREVMKVYLAGPIANMNDDAAKNWRNVMTTVLQESDIAVLDPFKQRDFRGVDSVTSMAVVVPDKNDIDDSEILLANAHTVSVGTSMEILYAWERGKYVITVVPNRERCSPWIMYHSHVVVTTLAEALAAILVYHDGPPRPPAPMRKPL